jgi:hypothetical protein
VSAPIEIHRPLELGGLARLASAFASGHAPFASLRVTGLPLKVTGPCRADRQWSSDFSGIQPP